MLKRITAFLIAIVMLFSYVPPVSVPAAQEDSVEISNTYIKVSVSRENAGYVIATKEGDILKKTDNDVSLTHRGKNMDTSFTSFRINGEDFIFGNQYGFMGHRTTDLKTEVDPGGNFIKSTWCIDDIEISQEISLVSNGESEQLGTALICYTVNNRSGSDAVVKSRVLMDTQLGENDYGVYEIPNQKLGQGYEYIQFEETLDITQDAFLHMPADYFVKGNEQDSSIVGFGVNNVLKDEKPYRMTFANWSNIAATKFDYEPDPSANFTNPINDRKAADSAVALYYDMGTIAGNNSKSFSTYYGVTANIKNKDNKILINTTAPSKLEFTDDTRTEYKGSEASVGNNIVRVNVSVTNPVVQNTKFKYLTIVVYTTGFIAQRQNQLGEWSEYDNVDPLCTNVKSFEPGTNKVTYFDFKFKPQDQPQLGSFVIKVFNMDPAVNELGVYAEEFCLGSTENFIIIPGQDPSLPAITLAGLKPGILYNEGTRFMTVHGQGVTFFQSDLLDRIELRGENGKTYIVSTEGMMFGQTQGGEPPTEMTLQLNEYMEPGSYQLYFVWKPEAANKDQALQGVPEVFTSSSMKIEMSSDPYYRNDKYGIVTIQRDPESVNKYKAVAYKDETEFQQAQISEKNVLLVIRGDIIQDKENTNLYRMVGKDTNATINHILNYHGSDLTVEQKADGSVFVLMDGKITSIGANTTVRDGTAAFSLKAGKEYLVPVYDTSGVIVENEKLLKGQDFIELKWDNSLDSLTTIGGFLINLKYGVLGKMQNGDGTNSDIISFGGGLDLSFMTPGAAAAARANRKNRSWTTQTDIVSPVFNDSSGKFAYCTEEVMVEPDYKKPVPVEAGVEINDVLYGGKNPGYIGINMNAHATLPQIVKFLPNKIHADLSINTINGYEVGAEGEVKTAMIEMQMALVIKSNPSGAPVPDKLYFTIGGFEPGINVDGLGVTWLTGGGGGFDHLYDTIYGKDGMPPLTLLLNVQFDVLKILSGSADLSLSLRGVAVEFGDLSLKKIKDARFIDGGMFGVNWYPNFGFQFESSVNFLQIMRGSLSINVELGNNKNFFEMILHVALGVPEYIPIVGGMELASATLGGGSERVFGNITLLEIIELGFNYYWGGEVEFSSKHPDRSTRTISKNADEGMARTFALYESMIEPRQVGVDEKTGNPQFVSVGSNLSFVTGSTEKHEYQELRKAAENNVKKSQKAAPAVGSQTKVYTNTERNSHMVQFHEQENYILTVSRADGSKIAQKDLEDNFVIKTNGKKYPLSFYNSPGYGASDKEKKQLLDVSNINIVDGIAYIMIPKTDITSGQTFFIDFTDKNAYDVGAMRVDPVSKLTEQSVDLKGTDLTVNWKGTDLSDTAKVIVSISDVKDGQGVVLNEDDILAKYTKDHGSIKLQVPENMASGEYYVTLTLSDEGKSYHRYTVENPVRFVNKNSPAMPQNVVVSNVGNDKLKVDVTGAADSKNLSGYAVDVYVENADKGEWILADAGLYFDKEADIIIGGLYDMPVLDDNGSPVPEIDDTTGNPKQDENGNVVYKTIKVGYEPEKNYKVKVRAANMNEGSSETAEDDIMHCSAAVLSEPVKLIQSTPPVVTMEYDKTSGQAKISSDCKITGELYINGNIEKVYSFNAADTSHIQTLNLADGKHTLEFHGTDEEGDSVIIQQIFNVDTTPPVFLLETPISGQSFDGESLIVKGTGESDAEYTFFVNGHQITPTEGNDIFYDGTMFSCTLPLEELARELSLKLEMIAVDPEGNSSSKEINLVSKKIAEVKKISIYCNGAEETEGVFQLQKGDKAQITVIGSLEDGTKTDITDLINTQVFVNSGNSISIDGTSITGKTEGRSLLEAVFDIGGGRVLRDGLIIATDPVIKYEGLDAALDQAAGITQDGYTEESWNTFVQAVEAGKTFRSMTAVTQEIVDNAATAILEAIRHLGKPVFYTVTFDSVGGTDVKVQTIEEKHKAVKPEDPVKEGYIFRGWYTDKDLMDAYDFNKEVNASFTLYAGWEKEKVPVSFTALKQVLDQAGKLDQKDHTEETWQVLQEVVKEGNAVLKKKDATQEEVDAMVTKIQDAIAKLEDKKAVYTVIFNSMGGTAVDSQKITQGDSVKKPEDPVYEGYTFTGWYRDAQLTEIYNFADPVTESMTLYAGWEKDKLSPVYTGLENALKEAEKLVEDQYTPESWIPLQNGIDHGKKLISQGAKSQEEVDKAATQIMDAIKELIQKEVIYTVSFNTAGGSAIPSQEVEENKEVVQPEQPEKDGYTFDGWYVDEQLTEKYDFKTKVTSSFTLFAKWNKNPDIQIGYPYLDVLPSDWFYDDVLYVHNKDIMQGTSRYYFTPNGDGTRAVLAESLWKLDGKPVVNGRNPFTDVADDRKEKDGIIWAAQNGLMGEVDPGLFGPDQGISREDLAYVIYNYTKNKGYLLTGQKDLVGYMDASDVSADKLEALKWAVGNNMLHIREAGQLDPKEMATRAEIAAMLHLYSVKYQKVFMPESKPTSVPNTQPSYRPDTGNGYKPKTGDSSELFMWEFLLLLSMGGGIILVHRKKMNKNNV